MNFNEHEYYSAENTDLAVLINEVVDQDKFFVEFYGTLFNKNTLTIYEHEYYQLQKEDITHWSRYELPKQ